MNPLQKRLDIPCHGTLYQCWLERGRYENNVTAFTLVCGGEWGLEPFGVLSVNLEVDPAPDCFWLKGWSENEEMARWFIDNGMIELTGRTAQTGFVTAREARPTQKMNEMVCTPEDLKSIQLILRQ